jgi:DNA-directed RNA polymerase subunit M/transcription elongation factor TFIIS
MCKCPECGYTRDIRMEKHYDPDSRKTLIYYRCKGCGYQWDKNEYIVKEDDKNVKKETD